MNQSPLNNDDSTAVKALFKHGIDVFGSEENFAAWLNRPNFFFDKKAPIEFLNTPERIDYIDSRLTGLEYGDNA